MAFAYNSPYGFLRLCKVELPISYHFNHRWVLAMTTITFDTLEFTRRLTGAGVSREQAEATADAMKEAMSESDLVNKNDLHGGKCKSQIVSHNEAKTSEKAEFTWK
ncbi:MAG: Protein of unknown function (DUF1640) [Candidatus Kentron sp. G]|nr:MAG: Protein of unknown function (DUF1640) [Candidatus Kentron sp. G]VFN08144.1 MAG: Protein of unknown function (DUF1640) [Candidatus Kentron sp. G]